MAESPPLFGVAAAFATPESVFHAALRARQHGFQRLDAFSPAPVPGLAALLGGPRLSLPALGAGFAALGLVGYFGMTIYATMSSYPFLIAGRPPFSWPYFVIPSFSMGMLLGGLAVTLGMLFLSRLPRLNHPVFNIEGFERASTDRWFLTIEAQGKEFDPELAERFLAGLQPPPLSIQRVPR